MPPRHSYTYRSLHDVFQGHRPSLVNVYAIVTEWTMPRTTKGTDYHVILKVLDPSVASLVTELNEPYTDVSISFFASKELVPKPRKAGDIIRIHRLDVKDYNGRPQFVAKIGMLGAGGGAGGTSRCHYCLFDDRFEDFVSSRSSGSKTLSPGPGEGVTNDPYATSSHSHTFDPDMDVPHLSNLREYWTAIGGAAALPDSAFTIDLARIKHSALFDLHCRVLDVCEIKGKMVLVVWDGSDTRPFPPEMNTGNAPGDSQQQRPIAGGGGDSQLLEYGHHYWMPFTQEKVVTREEIDGPDGTPRFPGLGTAFPVVMRQFDISAEDLPAAGQWIRLRQLSSWVRQGQLQGLFVHSSKWAPAEPNEAFLAAAAKRDEKREVSLWAPQNQLGMSQSQSHSQSQGQGQGGGGWFGWVRGVGVGVGEGDGWAKGGPPQRQGALAAFGLTRTIHDDQPLQTLREVLMTEPPSRHRCLVRVVQHHPKDIHDFCSDGTEGEPNAAFAAVAAGGGRDERGSDAGAGESGAQGRQKRPRREKGEAAEDERGDKTVKTGGGMDRRGKEGEEEEEEGLVWEDVVKAEKEEPRYEFSVRLTLEDATGRLSVNLCHPDSNIFFHGITPCNLWESEVTFSQVSAKMRALLSHHHNRPEQGWVQCCIMSYVQPPEREGEEPKRCYRIFDTSVIA